MPKTKPFSNLLQRMTPERRAKIQAQVQLELLLLALAERQKSLDYTNEEMNILELENLDDVSVTLLSQYVKGLGGKLKIIADFPEQETILAQFE
ncbi:MAG: transcriptional regulator [Calothrix sp. MO_192.B10]|nr:transcriptional regulator [Calothrix sp. MO_192.B10]